MRALVLSGGAFRGAVQLPVIEHLASQHKYDFVYGVSVGSLNGVMLAQGKLGKLRDMWENVDGLKDFLRMRWWWPFGGLYSMQPLRSKIEKLVKLDHLQIPFAAGVVSLTDGGYYHVDSRYLKSDKDLWDGIHASSSISGIMVNPKILINGGVHVGADGGFRNIIPVPPPGEFAHIDVVTCTPLDRIHNEIRLTNGIGTAMRGIEIMEDEIFQRDINEIKARSREDAVITIYSPQSDVGPSFEAHAERIKQRLKLGEEAIHYPVVL